MTQNSGSEDTPNEAAKEEPPAEPDLRGRYVEGDYGKAGSQTGRHADDEEGRYGEGNYGAAGSEGGLPEPLGDKAGESGRYVQADYGAAGSVPGRTAASEVGRYPEGSYGAGGSVDPARKAKAVPGEVPEAGSESGTASGVDQKE
ncbi:hypothetical protein PY310_18960 [Pseudarthrobacter sp. H3Y2-7]|uniref:hypothetical protein n=1 Tax=Pseudarthrobacter naphthalenicus TaxID=3031328 RepID=UPI0023B02827|nr:hypothetical protein [Pseudarthrobacter sp. H3Y2-7]MDE8670662.1 hypothetical protein [Pseudarthrobacter sp. H3Y2-7]